MGRGTDDSYRQTDTKEQTVEGAGHAAQGTAERRSADASPHGKSSICLDRLSAGCHGSKRQARQTPLQAAPGQMRS